MAKKRMYVGFILDETGSMSSVWGETISGYNKYVDELAADANARIRFTMAKFDSSKFDVVHNRIKIADVPHLTQETYIPGAMTPLYDAIGKGIRAMEKATKMAKEPRVCMTILTDGHENASREFTFKSVQTLIEEKKKKNWTFVFLGAEPDSVDVAQSLGVPQMNTMIYDSSAPQAAYAAAAVGTRTWTKGGGAQSSSFFSDTDEEDDEDKPPVWQG